MDGLTQDRASLKEASFLFIRYYWFVSFFISQVTNFCVKKIRNNDFYLTLFVKSKQEIENMRRNCESLRALNLELKAKVIIIIIIFFLIKTFSELDLMGIYFGIIIDN